MVVNSENSEHSSPLPVAHDILVLERPRAGIRAYGYHTGCRTEFVVQAGATLAKEIKPSLLPRIRAIRDELLAVGAITDAGSVLVLKRDHVCHSTSSAAAVVLAVSAHGLWKWQPDRSSAPLRPGPALSVHRRPGTPEPHIVSRPARGGGSTPGSDAPDGGRGGEGRQRPTPTNPSPARARSKRCCWSRNQTPFTATAPQLSMSTIETEPLAVTKVSRIV